MENEKLVELLISPDLENVKVACVILSNESLEIRQAMLDKIITSLLSGSGESIITIQYGEAVAKMGLWAGRFISRPSQSEWPLSVVVSIGFDKYQLYFEIGLRNFGYEIEHADIIQRHPGLSPTYYRCRCERVVADWCSLISDTEVALSKILKDE